MIQIFGTRKCKDTRKAERYFKERRVKIHFVDLSEKSISPGELKSISNTIPLEDLIDTEGREYEKNNLKYMKFNIDEELLNNPLLFKTPIVRFKGRATIGIQSEIWGEWINVID
jgi:arsenate reductase